MLKDLGLVIYIEFLRSNRQFIATLKDQANDILTLALASSLTRPALDVLITSRLAPAFRQYFTRGIAASQTLVAKEVAEISNILNVPLKYNRQVLENINKLPFGANQSIFTGYFDVEYAEKFQKKELDRLKRTLLRVTYNNADERVLRDKLISDLGLTKRRAQLLARGETKRLRESTKVLYYQDPGVKQEYELVWVAKNDSRVRPEHLRMDGKTAEENGYFISPDFGEVLPPMEYGCRCSTFFRKRSKQENNKR